MTENFLYIHLIYEIFVYVVSLLIWVNKSKVLYVTIYHYVVPAYNLYVTEPLVYIWEDNTCNKNT